MGNQSEPKLAKWPFFLGDALLLGAACLICSRIKSPISHWELFWVVTCVASGAVLSITPFLLEYRALVKLAEAGALTETVAQIQNLEAIAGRISGATGLWQNVQEQANKTAATAADIAQRMTAEVQAFTEFMRRTNGAEKATLRLEVEKLRRAENDWLHVLVRVLDHVYALHLGALRSGQPNLIAQLGAFQNACHDSARRVGLAPFTAGDAEPFDAQRHQLIESDSKPEPDAIVGETVAAGYTYQGRMLRPALVRLRNDPAYKALELQKPEGLPEDEQSQLPLSPAATAEPVV